MDNMGCDYDCDLGSEYDASPTALSEALVDLEDELQTKSREFISNVEEVLRKNLLPGPLDLFYASLNIGIEPMRHDTSIHATGLPAQHGTRSGVYGDFYEARVRPLSRTLHAPTVSSLPQGSDRLLPQSLKPCPRSSSVVSYADASGVSDSGGESDYQPVPRKRKHASTNPPVGAMFPPRKRAKTHNAASYVRSRSVRGRRGREAGTLSLMETKLSDYQDEDAVNNLDENSKCLLVHSIDWDDPPTWGNDVIPRMPATAILPYLKDRYDLHGSVTCLWNGCGQQMNVAMSLKNHLHCDSHINLRRKCPRCSWSVRPDMWNSRYPNHLCGESFSWKK